jgi:hypothetical protein
VKYSVKKEGDEYQVVNEDGDVQKSYDNKEDADNMVKLLEEMQKDPEWEAE